MKSEHSQRYARHFQFSNLSLRNLIFTHFMSCKAKKSTRTNFICKLVPFSVDNLYYSQGYHKFCHHHWRPYEVRSTSFERFKGNNTGVLFWGERGTGKSQILAYVSAWAHENKWINVTISNHEDLVRGVFDMIRHKNGLYL